MSEEKRLLPRKALMEQATGRMKKLGLPDEIISAFERGEGIYMCTPPLGNYSLLTENEVAWVKDFEQEHGVMVYLGIRTVRFFGMSDSFLFVSGDYVDWQYESAGLDKGCAYAFNYDYHKPDESRFGNITFERTKGQGLIRTQAIGGITFV